MPTKSISVATKVVARMVISPLLYKRVWHALRYSEGRGARERPRPSEYLRACHPNRGFCYMPDPGMYFTVFLSKRLRYRHAGLK